VTTEQARAAPKGHTGNVMALTVAPDGSWLAYSGLDSIVRIWDVANGRERATLKGHAGNVRALAVAPDGRWLASGTDDGTLQIWDMATQQPYALMRLDSNINACAWLGTEGLVVGGSLGLYLFDFRPMP
jgi:WD40 repeat protein